MLSTLFVLAMGACGGLGSCGACSSTGPLPPGGLPRDQTIEGGAQIRVTPQGFNKLQSVLPAALNQQLQNGFCVARGTVGNPNSFPFTGANYCTRSDATTCAPGCQVNVHLNSLIPTVTNDQLLNIKIATHVDSIIGINGKVLGIGFSCNLGVSSDNLNGNFDIRFGIRADNGELDIHLDQIHQFQLGLDFSGCGPVSDIGNLISTILDSFVGQFIIQLLTPAIDDLIQGFLPNPLGIAGMLDGGKLLEKISPGTEGFMEARMVPGGYVGLVRNGMSLGMITGLNADEDPATRTPALDSEPALCVPPFAAPSFAGLPMTPRQTFALGAANEFIGLPDPQADLAMGISETTLDLAGHHAVTSGMMCLGVGTSYINQLNVGTIGILVPSVSELGSKKGNDPLLLVTRPQRPLDFTIGDNTMSSPAITIGIQNMEVDFYAFLYERYTRVFTIDLTMNVGVNLEFEQPPTGPAQIKPTLVGISSDKVKVKVLNNQFVEEKKERLEMVLPSVFDLVTPLLGNLPTVNVPDFAGFKLDNLAIKKVVTQQDDFLALTASLGASQLMRNKARTDMMWAAAVNGLDGQARVMDSEPSRGQARLAGVLAPEPAKVRAALTNQEMGEMPEVVFDVDRTDARGRQLEWAYNLNGGMWRPYAAAGADGKLVIRDRAFAWQGKYTIGLKSRVVGNYRTTSAETATPVIIDSVGPRVLAEDATWDGTAWELPLFDIVSGRALQWAFGKPGDAEPATEWQQGGLATLDKTEMGPFLVEGELAVFARDEAGNVTIALIAPFHGQPGEGGCDCSSGGPSPGGLALVAIVGFALLGKRRQRRAGSGGAAARTRLRAVRTHLARARGGRPRDRALRRSRGRGARMTVACTTWLGLSAVLSLAPGCDCGNNPEKSCETVADCGPDFCGDGEIAFCIDNTCVCSDDIIPGRIGPYSDVAVGADGAIWVSAYAQTYGDLVVARAEPGRIPDEAWEWVDGVPDGPVIVEDSKYRFGIAEKGPDVGMYTSIAVAPDGTPMVSYFDRDTASLMFAMKKGDTWTKHVVEAGTGMLGELSGELVGMYTSITLRTDDGRPGIAYLAHISDAQGARAEVRFVASQSQYPTSAADWQTWIVDKAPLPPDDPGNPNIYPLPEGLGLFVDAARLRTQAPVLVYYDRANGDLKLARFNPQTGQFQTPVVLDGSGIDAGWAPSVAVDAQDVVHVAYVGATGDDLKYITDAPGAQPVVIDNGYRLVGMTVDGLPKPEFHFVGEDASLVLANHGTLPMVAYQDATTQELLLSTRLTDGTWDRISIAGARDPWPGAYGFFTSDAVTASSIVMSTWVIDQPTHENWVEVFSRSTIIQ